MTFAFRAADWILLSPELFLTAAGLVMLGLSVAIGKKREDFLAFLAVLMIGVTVAFLVFVGVQPDRAKPILGGAFVVDNFALFFKALILLSLALTVLASAKYVADDNPGLWKWVIFPPNFHAPNVMALAKREAWTLKPAMLHD